jgi:hypothetical protein
MTGDQSADKLTAAAAEYFLQLLDTGVPPNDAAARVRGVIDTTIRTLAPDRMPAGDDHGSMLQDQHMLDRIRTIAERHGGKDLEPVSEILARAIRAGDQEAITLYDSFPRPLEDP